MSGWRQFADSIPQDDRPGTKRTNGTKPSSEAPFVPIVPIVPKVRPLNPSAVLREWHRHLSELDACRPPDGFARNWWGQAVDDAHWLYVNFCSQAVRDGWGAHDMFGVLPFDHSLGGLVARLRGARNLKMEGPKAVWSSWGVRDWTCAGTGDGLVRSGIVLLWELRSGLLNPSSLSRKQ